MALFTDDLAQEIAGLALRRYRELGLALGDPHAQEDAGTLDEQAPLQRDLRLLIQVANGVCQRDEATLRQVEAALTRVLEVLADNALHVDGMLPDDFWQTDFGVVVSRARWWISMDDLITISNAAALAFGENSQANRMRIVRAIDKGLLDSVPDPSVANPQQNRRVLRPQVERLRDLRRLPE